MKSDYVNGTGLKIIVAVTQNTPAKLMLLLILKQPRRPTQQQFIIQPELPLSCLDATFYAINIVVVFCK